MTLLVGFLCVVLSAFAAWDVYGHHWASMTFDICLLATMFFGTIADAIRSAKK